MPDHLHMQHDEDQQVADDHDGDAERNQRQRQVVADAPQQIERKVSELIDWMIDKTFARERIQKVKPVQGNLDPLALIAGGEALEKAVADVLSALEDRPHIFNLGHGILPDTPIAHVEQLLKLVRG